MSPESFMAELEDLWGVKNVSKLDDKPTYTIRMDNLRHVGSPLTEKLLQNKLAIVEIAPEDDTIFAEGFEEQEKQVTKKITAFNEL